jgi:N-acetylglucosaminyldiphosphoundecaprenol N-acetyl-beta-D-mannosaminyltransferase
MRMPRYEVLGIRVDAVDMAATVETVERWIAAAERHYVCHLTVHGVMEALHDPALSRIYENAGLTVPDGMPLVWLGRRAYPAVGRVYGPDLMLALSRAAARAGYACFYYGGIPGVAEALAAEMEHRFPGLRTVGAYAPPFRDLDAAETEAVIARINDAGPDIVWVGLGCPKQERWMATFRPRLRAPVLIGVGAAFDFHTGRAAQAPPWMQRAGLEWLFRLCHEPRRLWHRYLVYNPLFLVHLGLEATGLRRYGPVPRDPGGASS